MKQVPKNPKKLARKSSREKKPQPPKKPSQVRSGYEFRILKGLESAGVLFEYESEKIKYVVPEKSHNYIPDFIIRTASGKRIYVEGKGNFDPSARKKMKLVVEQHPELDIRMLLMRDNKINKQSKTKYSDWCTKNGIPYHVSSNGTIPRSWLDE